MKVTALLFAACSAAGSFEAVAQPSTGAIDRLYAVSPDMASCRPGQMSAAARSEILESVNRVRALHLLPPVTYLAADEPQAMAAALMMSANRSLSHSPPARWRCYSALGAHGAGSANLHGGVATSLAFFMSNDAIVAGWVTDIYNSVPNNIGHRRWILDPFLTTIAFGRAAIADGGDLIDSAVLKVFDFSASGDVPRSLPEFVAYPFGDYPARYFESGARLSFGAIADRANKSGNANVSYARAAVTVRQRGGAALTVSNISFDTSGFGLPNNIQFDVAGLVQGTMYEVTVANVEVNGAPRTYTYSFRIVA